MYYAAVGLFAVGVLVAYFAGMRNQKGWGMPLLVVCLVGIIGAVIARQVAPARGVTAPKLTAGDYQAAAKLLAGALADDLPQDATVCVVVDLGRDANIEKVKLAWESGIREGATGKVGAVTFVTGESAYMLARNARSIMDIENVPEADAVVFLTPRPWPGTEDLQEAGKLVAVFFPVRGDGRSTITEAERDAWLEHGMLDVIIVEVDGAEPEVYKASK